MRRLVGARREERGAVLVLYAVAMTAMLTMVALVIDLAQLRTDRQVNKSVTDQAVRAGLGVLQAGPWSGVCRARDYLVANAREFSALDSGSEQWLQLGSPVSAITTSPCVNPALGTLCLPGALGVPNTSTWGKLTATADSGRFTIEIQSGYAMPDPRFPEDTAAAADTGDPLKGSCDNLAVIITERRTPLFAGFVGAGQRTTTVRSVGRLSNISSGQYNPALLLLERHGCSVLTTSGANTRVIAQPYLDHAGVLQVDSADDSGGCASNQAVLNGQTTAGGPSIVACSAKTFGPTPGCNLATGDNPSHIGMYGLNFPRPSSDYLTSSYAGGTYGDTQAVRSAQSGRGPLDLRFRQDSLVPLDVDAKSVLLGNAGMPPGCTSVVGNACTGVDSTGKSRTWLVLQQSDCNSVGTFFSPLIPVLPPRTAAQNVWFNCNLNVNPTLLPIGLTLTAPDAYVVITGSLSITSTFAITDPRTVYIGGTDTGNKIGLNLGNGANLSVGNPAPLLNCPPAAGLTRFTKLVVGKGAFNMASGATAHLCQTFVFMANGYDRVPATDNTAPCACTGSTTYLGTVSIGSGSNIDWQAPNLIVGRQPTADDVRNTSPYEDLGLWTEAGGSNTSSVNGGGSSAMTGIFFLPNAAPFKLAGNSGANVSLNAQFIATSMAASGGAVVNLVLNPSDSIPVVVYQLVLVR